MPLQVDHGLFEKHRKNRTPLDPVRHFAALPLFRANLMLIIPFAGAAGVTTQSATHSSPLRAAEGTLESKVATVAAGDTTGLLSCRSFVLFYLFYFWFVSFARVHIHICVSVGWCRDQNGQESLFPPLASSGSRRRVLPERREKGVG